MQYKVGDRVRMYITLDHQSGVTPKGTVIEAHQTSPTYQRLRVRLDNKVEHVNYLSDVWWVFSKQCRKLKQRGHSSSSAKEE